MPTPVAAARQCLTTEAAAALDEAVAVACRRGHTRTTSLHMLFSLLSLPNSCLREACTTTRSNPYSTLFQLGALELSLTVSLDRLPSSQATRVDEPPVSNSLMAAIKRSQASQRRQPENFSFYHHHHQQQRRYMMSSSVPAAVKIELRNLIVSILDDPLVSKVFAEGGFRSCDIKMAMLRRGNYMYPSYMYTYSLRYKQSSTPLFSCNLSTSAKNYELGNKGCTFPFMGCYENCRRIGEVMVRSKKRNPILLGVSAEDALKTFLETLETKTGGVLPVGLSSLNVVRVEDDVLKFLNGDSDELRFDEAERMLGNDEGNKVVVNLGDLKDLAEDDVRNIDGVGYNLVGKVRKLLDDHGGKLWLIGAAETYEVYFKILKKFPSIEEEWDLEILHITSLIFGRSYPKSSLMAPFVPLGGFFSTPSDAKCSSSSACQFLARRHQCNDKYNQEKSAFAATKAKDDRLLLNAKNSELQKKRDIICQQHHYNRSPRVGGFEFAQNTKENTSNDSSRRPNASSTDQGNTNFISSPSSISQQSSSLKALHSFDMPSRTKNPSIVSKSGESASANDDRTSPNSVPSVTTELGLGLISSPTDREAKKPADESQEDHQQTLYRALVERVGHQEEAIASVVEAITRRSTKTRGFNGISRGDVWINLRGPDRVSKKRLGLALAEMLYGGAESFIYVDLSFQDEMAATDTVLHRHVTNKYDISMRGTVVDYLVEKLSKKPCVVFLENVDKSDHVVQATLSRALKTGRFTDLHGREVSTRNSVFLTTASFLEGGVSLSNGKESAKCLEGNVLEAKGRVLKTSMGFDLNDEATSENRRQSDATERGCSALILMSKRKINGTSGSSTDQCGGVEATKKARRASNGYLDLNLPAQTSELCRNCSGCFNSDSSPQGSRSWLEDFHGRIDRTVVIRPLDFDALDSA